MQKSVKQFQIIMKLIISVHLYLIYCALIPEIKSHKTDELVCGATKQKQQQIVKCIASDTSTSEGHFFPIAFHQVMHFSSRTLTLNLSTLLMSTVREGDVSERLTGHKIASNPHSDTRSLSATAAVID